MHKLQLLLCLRENSSDLFSDTLRSFVVTTDRIFQQLHLISYSVYYLHDHCLKLWLVPAKTGKTLLLEFLLSHECLDLLLERRLNNLLRVDVGLAFCCDVSDEVEVRTVIFTLLLLNQFLRRHFRFELD